MAEKTFGFWYRLVNLYDPKKPDELRRTQFRPYVERLILQLSQFCHLKEDVDPFVFKRRQAIFELINALGFIVDAASLCENFFSATDGRIVKTLESVEASVFILQAVDKNFLR